MPEGKTNNPKGINQYTKNGGGSIPSPTMRAAMQKSLLEQEMKAIATDLRNTFKERDSKITRMSDTRAIPATLSQKIKSNLENKSYNLQSAAKDYTATVKAAVKGAAFGFKQGAKEAVAESKRTSQKLELNTETADLYSKTPSKYQGLLNAKAAVSGAIIGTNEGARRAIKDEKVRQGKIYPSGMKIS